MVLGTKKLNTDQTCEMRVRFTALRVTVPCRGTVYMNSSFRTVRNNWAFPKTGARRSGPSGKGHASRQPGQRPRGPPSALAKPQLQLHPCHLPSRPLATRLQGTHKTHRRQHATARTGMGELQAQAAPGSPPAQRRGAGFRWQRQHASPSPQDTGPQLRHAHLQSNGGQF